MKWRCQVSTVLFVMIGMLQGCISLERSVAANCRYEVSVRIGADNKTVATTARVTYRNSRSDALPELLFHFTPGKDGDLGEQVAVVDSSNRPLQVLSYAERGRRGQKEYFRVKLAEPLGPGRSVELKVTTQAVLRDRHGIKHLEGCWHPRIVHRTREGWQLGVEEFANYRVTIGPLSQSLIPTSGINSTHHHKIASPMRSI